VSSGVHSGPASTQSATIGRSAGTLRSGTTLGSLRSPDMPPSWWIPASSSTNVRPLETLTSTTEQTSLPQSATR
jgi:hypothetical protein